MVAGSEPLVHHHVNGPEKSLAPCHDIIEALGEVAGVPRVLHIPELSCVLHQSRDLGTGVVPAEITQIAEVPQVIPIFLVCSSDTCLGIRSS